MTGPPTTILLEPPRACPEAELPWVRSFIAACRFTFATQGDLGGAPVVESPHEYCPRRSLDASSRVDFDRFAELIERHGYRGRFLNVVYRYLDGPGDDGSSWRYWISDAYFPPAARGMINRASNSLAPMRLPRAKSEVAHVNQQLYLDNFAPEARDA